MCIIIYLSDANLVCGISRVESMLQVRNCKYVIKCRLISNILLWFQEEDTEGLKSARGFLMEIYGKIENLNFDSGYTLFSLRITITNKYFARLNLISRFRKKSSEEIIQIK